MQVNSVALTAGYSSILNLQTLDTNGPIAFILSVGETAADRFNLYGTLDAAATDNTNAFLIGVFSGGASNLPTDIAARAKTWPFLLIQRTSGSTGGTLFAAGNPATLPAVVSVAAPAVAGAYSAVLDMSTLSAETVRIGSSRQMTALDSFEVYLSNDSSIGSYAGAYYAGRIYGGGGANINNTVLVSGFAYAVFLRVGGSATGTMLAAGVSPVSGGGGGTLNLTTLTTVGDTAVNGPLGGLSPAASVDAYNSFLLTQTTPYIAATLPDPTDTTVGRTAFVMNDSAATQPITMYGMSVGVGASQLFEWTGSVWVGGRNITQGGNAFGAPIVIGSTDNRPVTIQGGGMGASAWEVGLGGALNLGANATDHPVTVGSVSDFSLTTVQGGSSGVTIQPAATGPVSIISGSTGAATFDSGSTGAVSIAASDHAKVVTVGNLNAGTETHLLAGALGIDISTGATTGGAINIVADGVINIDTLGTTAINIGAVYPFGRNIFIGTSADPSSVTVTSGSGGILLDSSSGAGVVNVTAGAGGVSISCAATGPVSITTGSGVGINTGGTPSGSAILQADSATRGFLPPRMTTAQRTAIGTPAEGLQVYDTTIHKLYLRTAAAWEQVTSV